MKKVHFFNSSMQAALCCPIGYDEHNVLLTDDVDKVTCKACLKKLGFKNEED